MRHATAAATESLLQQSGHRAGFLLAGLLAMAMAAVLTAPVAAQEHPSASPAPAALAPLGQLAEGLTPEMATRIAEVVDQVLPIRGLPAADDIDYRVIDPDRARADLEAIFREEYPEAYVDAEETLWKRLGLIPEDADLEELTLSLYESQILAFYDPRTKTFSIVGPVEDIGGFEALIVAHEYGHALQDARWDLEGSRITDLSRSDEILAQLALVEGDATAVMYDWAARELNLAQLVRISSRAFGQQDERLMRRIPPLLRRQLEFPYIEGYAFVNAIRGRGDWAAVDAVWDARPVSTEQILHPELYPHELPVEVSLPDVAGLLGDGWVESYEQTLGELQIWVWVADGRKARSLFPILPAQLPRAEAAAGWGGDRLVSLDGPDGAWAVVWQTAWDSAEDATEFRRAARAAMRDLPGAQEMSDADVAGGLSSPVLVLVADGEETLAVVKTALGLDDT